ncbi:MAG: hypothetical protein AW09_003174 [Candidatus Accumulibacter phosphatis]|uniref:Uncharacterized protein n=1 Tax=Candidatus Accumulibacter phosphatis TaxID=327160 RepID=A0A080M3H0_9PROT|nr:MAG: hypothetical protein AW09_003174 [Candidatus Accumulibacter phosphatis]
MQHEHRYRHQQPRNQEDQQRGHFEAHDVAEQAHGQRDGAGELAEQMKRQEDRAGDQIVAQIILQAFAADAEPVHRDKNQTGQRGGGRQVTGRRMQARHDPGHIGDGDEQPEGADERQQQAGSAR